MSSGESDHVNCTYHAVNGLKIHALFEAIRLRMFIVFIIAVLLRFKQFSVTQTVGTNLQFEESFIYRARVDKLQTLLHGLGRN